jgi:hypothetical protein
MRFKALLFGTLLTLPALGQKIQTIRVAPLVSTYPGEQQYADLITAKLISHLVGAGVSVVEGASETPTDAVLKVTYMVQTTEDNGFKQYHFQGPVRLTDMNGKVVWADEIRNNPFAYSASSSFAENIARKVEAFISKQK